MVLQFFQPSFNILYYSCKKYNNLTWVMGYVKWKIWRTLKGDKWQGDKFSQLWTWQSFWLMNWWWMMIELSCHTVFFLQLFPMRRECMRRNAATERKNIGVVTVPLFQASSQILDGALLVICHPGNKDNGGEACDGLVYLSRTFADRNYHNR